MILTCPNCSMRYSASASAIGASGRKVRCASCGHSWMVDSNGQTLGAAPQPDAPETNPMAEAAPTPSAEPQAAEPASVPEEPRRNKPEVAKALRAKREAERQQKARQRSLAIWAGIAACLVIVLGLSFMFRVNVVRLWPNTASAFAAVGMPVNRFGLEVQDLSAARQVRAGSTVLVVSGNVMNISGKSQNVPQLQVNLHDAKSGKIAFSWAVSPKQTQLGAHEKLPFVSELRDPPPSELELEVVFTDTQAQPTTQTAKADEPGHPQDTADSHDEPAPAEPMHNTTPDHDGGGH